MRAAVLCALTVCLGSGAAWAQEEVSCQVQLDSVGGDGYRDELGPGRIHLGGSGGVWFSCLGQRTTIYADSAAWYSELDRMDLVGSVQFRDSATALDTDRARYFTVDERLEAYGNVRLENRQTGSVLVGPNLTYYREVPGVRDTTELYATARPTVEYRSSQDTSGAPYVIVGDRVRLIGDAVASAWGSVTIDREDFAAQGDSATLNTELGEGFLMGHAEAAGTDSASYTISGRRVAFRLTDDALSWVQAQGLAQATSAEWQMAGDTIEFNVANDLIQGGGVWGDSTRPRAMSQSHTIVADSLALDAPDQVLTEVRGFGAARATTHADSLTTEADWMAGDTVVARFDSTEAGTRALVMLEARGHAQAFYHIYDEDDRSLTPGVNYARGVRITARFKDDDLERVDVVDGDGIYLEPPGRRRP
ncbi:MAG: hypothetical protein GTN62_09045 [Gemmatimonadales bacterium]|nr:hypothetical protein [Gemmatimonadales bacterium]NIN11636.1 hypothetical protein [Gemmatimonadales bacterium]NIN50242.1 hypothetical protein [Gemmatimonadales bacterium]NIP07706.1 hypothetical protein [Gemmatimonadales bacterium]NIR01858.1 hypothetical protein [Gemmatimonadales bacterium]